MGEHRRKADGRRVFSTDFKRATVQRVVTGEKTVAELSRELDIAPSVIRSWKRFAEAGATTAVQAHSAFDVSREEVLYEHNGVVVGTYTAAEVMANPLNALVWLANHLATRGLALEPGDVVMSDAISKMLRPKVGDTIRANFAHLGSVSIKVVP